MDIEKQDLINKLETLVSELEYFVKRDIDPDYRGRLCEEVREWIEELRNNKVRITEAK